MVWWILATIGAVVLNCVLGYTTYNMLRKNEEADDYICILLMASETAIENMRQVDLNGSFEADDEVAVTFQALKAVTEDYAEVIGFPRSDPEPTYSPPEYTGIPDTKSDEA